MQQLKSLSYLISVPGEKGRDQGDVIETGVQNEGHLRAMIPGCTIREAELIPELLLGEGPDRQVLGEGIS